MIATLALGQASYELLDVLDGYGEAAAKVTRRGTTETLQATARGRVISDVEIRGDGQSTLNITDKSEFLSYRDLDVNTQVDQQELYSNSNINILADSNYAFLELGAGNNRVNASRNLTNSFIEATSGDNIIRIGGSADGTSVNLGDGNDQFISSRHSTDLDVFMGGGNDTALHLGTLQANTGDINSTNLIDMGEGNDRSTFLGGVRGVEGGVPGSSGYEIQLGDGNDTAVFGGNSSSDGFVLNTGTGSDNVILGRNTSNAVIDLGLDYGVSDDVEIQDPYSAQGDLVVLGLGATLSNSGIRSLQSLDTLRLAGSITDTSLDLGWGNSLVTVDGAAGFGTDETTVWDLREGNDTLIFGESSDISLLGDGSGFISLGAGADELLLLGSGYGAGAIEFDLGNDEDADTIIFGLDSSYAGFVISNFGYEDVLFIGTGSYGYGYQFMNEFANEYELAAFRDASNVIWAKDDDEYGISQSLMTLDADNFVPMSDDGEEIYSETVAGNGQLVTYLDTSTIESLADVDSWIGAESSPMSGETTPEPIMPDGQSYYL